jgi:predicted Zn finger-like uncharacterized protein
LERDGVKFLCDRCKTRYSIGDDRVRGKILKIRCKNCANVITVREGMTADDDPARSAERGRPTTAAPLMSVAPAPANNGALASAFAEQLAKPPPALEEEWYVSIEGAQSGPFGLAEAQRWVAAKPFDAELHCWSEGFDDWLPVDKVSHFRGLRRKPAAPSAPPLAAPPPMPRNRAPAMVAAVPEDEPKPLFAATMASLEKAAPAPAAGGMTRSPSAQVPSIPTNGAKANGTGPAARLNGTGASAAQAAIAAAFDVSPSEREPAPNIDAFKDLRAKAPSAPVPQPPGDDDGDDNLDIGEVSRVVNLADLARSHAAKSKPNVAAAAPRVAPARPSLGRMTNSIAKVDPAHLGIDATASIDALPPMPEGLAAAPVVAQAHRRGLIMLIGVAALLLAGVTAALVFMLNKDADTDESGLGPQMHGIDTSRPEEVVRSHMVAATEGSASTAHQQIRHTQPTPQKLTTTGPSSPETPDAPGTHLKPEEIEDMAAKNSTGTNRCYMRAQRGEMGLEVGDLKKISVTLSVDKTGAVTDVQLSDHAGDSLGNCLANQIKRWKFRESSGGQFRFALAFAN